MQTLTSRKAWFVLAAIVSTLVIYFLVMRPALAPTISTLIEEIALGGLALAAVITLLIGLFTLGLAAFSKKRHTWLREFGEQMLFLVIVVALLAGLVLGSQWTAHTPPILGEDGKPLHGSIATMEKVRLGGVDQWLILRGQDVEKPVLLFLSGGSEAACVFRFNAELEKHFVIVVWEQRGCGKSYPSINPKADLTIDQYTSDIIG